jgi:hypothetical protein
LAGDQNKLSADAGAWANHCTRARALHAQLHRSS